MVQSAARTPHAGPPPRPLVSQLPNGSCSHDSNDVAECVAPPAAVIEPVEVLRLLKDSNVTLQQWKQTHAAALVMAILFKAKHTVTSM